MDLSEQGVSESSESVFERLLEATEELSGQLDTLSKSVKTTTVIAKRSRNFSRLAVLFTVLSLIGVGLNVALYYNIKSVSDNTKAVSAMNTYNAIIACQNANEQRSGNLTVWSTFVGLLVRDSDPHTKLQAATFVNWLNQLYSAHDCSDLDKEYTVPPAPRIGR